MKSPTFCVVAIAMLSASSALAQHGDHGAEHTASTDARRAFVIHWRTVSTTDAIDEQLRVETNPAGDPIGLDRRIVLAANTGSLRLVRVIPRAARSQMVIPDAQGESPPAVELAVAGAGQVDTAWLLSGSPTRNRLSSLIANWRYAAAASQTERDALFHSFETELTRPPTIVATVVDSGESKEVPAQRGKQLAFSALHCTVRVKDFMPHFAIDKATSEAVNQSDERVNPAALVEIECSGNKTERWIFSRFPDFGAPKEGASPIRVTLDSSSKAAGKLPSFLIVTTALDKHELWVRGPREHEAIPLSLNQDVPIRGTSYTFSLSRFVPSAKLVEAYSPTDGRSSVTVLEFEYKTASGTRTTHWVELEGRTRVDLPTGELLVDFRTLNSTAGTHGEHSRGNP